MTKIDADALDVNYLFGRYGFLLPCRDGYAFPMVGLKCMVVSRACGIMTSAETAPLVICLAALGVKGIEVEP